MLSACVASRATPLVAHNCRAGNEFIAPVDKKKRERERGNSTLIFSPPRSAQLDFEVNNRVRFLSFPFHRSAPAAGSRPVAAHQQDGGVHPAGDVKKLSGCAARDQTARHHQHHRRHEDGARSNVLQSGNRISRVSLPWKRRCFVSLANDGVKRPRVTQSRLFVFGRHKSHSPAHPKSEKSL